MDLDDFFESKTKHHGKYHEHLHHGENRFQHVPYHSYQSVSRLNDQGKWIGILQQIRRSKNLKVLVVLSCLVFLVIFVLLIIVFLPFIVKLFDYISQNGLQGIFDGINSFVDKIWNGTKK